jgi:copper chaperone CopZ
MSMGLLNRSATKVELKGVHLCCDACVDGVGVALKDVEGVESHCDIGNRTVTLTSDDAAAQKALDALAAAGYHGEGTAEADGGSCPTPNLRLASTPVPGSYRRSSG